MTKFDDANQGFPFLSSLLQTREPFFTSDSREATEGSIFIALKGRNSDGHSYLNSLKNKGLLAVVVEEEFANAHPVALTNFGNTEVIVVPEGHLVHCHVAHEMRKKSNAVVVAVGGSAGKTTTKDFLFDLVSPYKKSFKTLASQNGHLGIPKTFEQLRNDHEVAIIEIGIDDIGDMQKHVELVEPDFAVLTSIGEEHLNLLKDIETVFSEERRLIDWVLKRNRWGFVPQTDTWLSKIGDHPRLMRAPKDVSELSEVFESHFFGTHVNQNLSLALQVALKLGLGEQQVQKSLKNLEVPEGRGRIEQSKKGAWIVADYYNSNPDSLKAGLEALMGHPRFSGLPRHLILGDMFDLGEASLRAHESIVPSINKVGAESIILVGEQMIRIRDQIQSSRVQCFKNTQEAASELKNKLFNGVIFLKASRGMYFEKILEVLR